MKATRFDPKPSNIVPMQAAPPLPVEEARAKFKAGVVL